MEKTIVVAEDLSKKLVEDYKLPVTDAEHIVSSFSEVAKTISEVDKELTEFNQADKTEITKEICEQAKKIRLKYVKARTLGDSIHKAIKANVLTRAKAIDGMRNILKLQIVEREEPLKNIETHFEQIKEQERVQLERERVEMLRAVNFHGYMDLDLGNLDEGMWKAFYASKKEEHEEKLAEGKRLIAEEKETRRITELNEARRVDLIDLVQFMEDKNMKLGELSEEDFTELKNGLTKKKKKFDKDQKKIREDNARLKEEADIKAKALEVERKKVEAALKNADDVLQKQRDNAAIVAKELQDKKDADALVARDLAAKAAAEKEVQKTGKYKDFLKEHGITKELVENKQALVKQEGDVVRVYILKAVINLAE